MKASVIISTYNEPEWLEKVLWGYEVQLYKNFEIVVADDGSAEPTRQVIERFRKESSLDIIHVWHEDRGYQKCQILNKAVKASTADYVIFTDGDCIPRNDFVDVHVRNAEKGRFLSGGAIRLPMNTSQAIGRSEVYDGRAFDIRWLKERGLPKNPVKNLKLLGTQYGFDRILNLFTPARASWNGGNSSTWKEYILASNGFDERMRYGGQDREFGERLVNRGIKGKQLRFSAVCVHLDYSRGYKTEAAIQHNLNIRKETRLKKKTWAEFGIVKSDREQPI